MSDETVDVCLSPLIVSLVGGDELINVSMEEINDELRAFAAPYRTSFFIRLSDFFIYENGKLKSIPLYVEEEIYLDSKKINK